MAVAVSLIAVSGVTVTVLPSYAAPPSSDPVTAAEYGASWLARLVNDQGFIPNALDAPNVSATIDTALALGAARVDEATFDRMLDWARTNVESVIVQGGFDQPGTIGLLLMLARLGDIPTNDFGGVDLLARLDATLGDFAPGLYGGSDPTYDGAYRQSMALLGIASTGTTPSPVATQWLVDQQCTGTPATATGGWQPYRANLADPCAAPDPVMFTGPDTNSTAAAIQALDALGVSAPLGPALDFLASVESETGGFGFIPGLDDDPNSTALVIQAIVAAGENPQSGRWMKGSHNPVTSLLSWQLGCDAAVADRGAFASPFSDGEPDMFATRQAVWGASLQPFPFTPGSFHPAAVPCQVTVSTTTTSLAPGSSTSTGSTFVTTTVVVSGSPRYATGGPEAAVPRFAG